MELQHELHPELEEKREQIERHTARVLSQPQMRSANGIITIPVVVHVVYNNASENISEAQILSQIDVLNEDFRRQNPDAVNTPADFQPVAADSEFEFCMATVDPQGNPTNGITRTPTNVSSFSPNNNMKFTSSGGRDAWPASDYLNIWVCDISGGILGYAQFPGGPASTDGIVVDYLYFGTVGVASPPFDLGRTATHEVGHYLNLRHIWGDGNCNIDDQVADTPRAGGPNYTGGNCTYPGPNSCIIGPNDLPDMFQNYMDYSDDDCMNLFTLGQKARMRALFQPGGVRASLLNSAACGTPTPPTCDDGLQNGDEEGVDCGGSACDPCPCYTTNLNLSITLDNYPQETSWVVTDASGNTVQSGGTYGSQPDGATLNIDFTLTEGNFAFTIFDSYGDGICCSYGQGSYTLADDTGAVIASGGAFGSSATTPFCIEGTTAACDDGLQNGQETGIDCGGPDCPACPTCDDGVQNGQETGVDCGGPDCPDCELICSEPINLSVNFVTTTSAILTWEAAPNAVGYEVAYNPVGGIADFIDLSATSYTLTGLSPGVTYEWGVRSLCTRQTSGFAIGPVFTTKDDGGCPDTDDDGVCDENDQCPGFDDTLIGTACDDGDACTENDVITEDCTCMGTLADQDGDGICDAQDQCPEFDDNLIGTACNDGNACTENDVITENCDCAGTPVDQDNDGVCDENDQCPGFDDTLIGTACDDGDACTENDVITENCECAGTLLDDNNNGICDLDEADCTAPVNLQATSITANSVALSWTAVAAADGYLLQYLPDGSSSIVSIDVDGNSYLLTGLSPNTSHLWRVRALCGADESPFSTIESFTTASESCPDADNDGVCNGVDQCPGFDDSLIGTPCNDGDECTENDVFTPGCECAGTLIDTNNNGICDLDEGCPDADADGVCDAEDQCPGFNDNLIGTPCDDGDDCTENDTFTTDCACVGDLIDADNNGLCDLEEGCTEPSGLNAQPLSPTAAQFSWNAVPNALAYRFQYRPIGGQGVSVDLTATNYTVTGFPAGATVQWRVRALCGTENSNFVIGPPAVLNDGARTGGVSNGFELFPNPTSGAFTVALPEPKGETPIITVRNAMGQELYQAAANKRQWQVDLSGLSVSSTVLFVTVQQAGQAPVTKRLVYNSH